MIEKIKVFDKKELERIINKEVGNNGPYCDLNHIDVSNQLDLSCLFANTIFKGDISQWDVSNVENMEKMFYASEFNGDIGDWNVSNVKSMRFMFKISKFNKDISRWDVSNVVDLEECFSYSNLDQDLSNWDVSKVKEFRSAFLDCPTNPWWNIKDNEERRIKVENYQMTLLFPKSKIKRGLNI